MMNLQENKIQQFFLKVLDNLLINHPNLQLEKFQHQFLIVLKLKEDFLLKILKDLYNNELQDILMVKI
ncbi:hypothetical protein GLOIN_2v1581516 [Rhizophagus irregularis DAOM 181602=DAOM 197198]|uniref:Uncharacterized protein n=1 Tax=Rhizophagus irregularis (strain DAOM 181602 / DAOM 197198 / MUCL 43194) TaxID=747089 RepID=A0A2P4Q882_RHIID|nr:hypothetical protein GLOIN_2v1581516 [Rhizophagus irregularis DAOM 181602=DAOM 197198]POG73839.1 hypothetical protein GLOIN_2v1581516 [Rhizophagus irregularis DAOM 181602=DAOM 197198]|eukprot:XP_025180705.1 hypothetical protein GLOIN_2v1581516 [Rhizophagus irregularis DAOM 181602=DAOM 197198]